MCKITNRLFDWIYELSTDLGFEASDLDSSKHNGAGMYFPGSLHKKFIAIRGVLQKLNENVFDKRMEEPSLRTHSRTLTKIPQSVLYDDNEACLKFATLHKKNSRTKHITIPYHFFWFKVNSLDIKAVTINTRN